MAINIDVIAKSVKIGSLPRLFSCKLLVALQWCHVCWSRHDDRTRPFPFACRRACRRACRSVGQITSTFLALCLGQAYTTFLDETDWEQAFNTSSDTTWYQYPRSRSPPICTPHPNCYEICIASSFYLSVVIGHWFCHEGCGVWILINKFLVTIIVIAWVFVQIYDWWSIVSS